MKPTLNEKFIAYLTLLSGLSLSAVAVYYSVVGLTAIFAAAAGCHTISTCISGGGTCRKQKINKDEERKVKRR